jgi:hypothetical protein
MPLQHPNDLEITDIARVNDVRWCELIETLAELGMRTAVRVSNRDDS